MNIVNSISQPMRTVFASFARDVTYRLHTGETATVKAFIRGIKEDDLFAGAMQQDQVAQVDAVVWKAAFPSRQQPQRYDRIITPANGQTFAVESFRGAPNDGEPVFFKLLLRGGQQ